MYSYLYDQDFLKLITAQQHQVFYTRIISLSTDTERPRECIEGRILSGSINIDGKSAIRRSCNLSIVADLSTPITDEYWTYVNKFKVSIGVNNDINPNYPDILWFDQGIYVITGFTKTMNTNNINISITGKDKMCLLNGEVSGNIPMENNFGIMDIENSDGSISHERVPLYDMILNAIKQYGHEQVNNIIINDLDKSGYELWSYKGQSPLYFLLRADSLKVKSVRFNEDKTSIKKIVTSAGDVTVTGVNFGNFEQKGYQYYSFNSLDRQYNESATKIKISNSNSAITYYLARVEYGEVAGYSEVPLTYGSDLILQAGEPITSLLDKVKAMLGQYEYFYDLQGRFVFQKQSNYIQELFTPFSDGVTMPTKIRTPYSFKFEDDRSFTAKSESFNLNNIKNDFCIWGAREGTGGGELPIHIRYAIQKKPTKYVSLPYYSPKTKKLVEAGRTYLASEYDWRELIYAMALDYSRHNGEPNYLNQLEKNNPDFYNGKTGYEAYYVDMLAFWRELYDPNPTVDKKEKYYDRNGIDGKGTSKYWNKTIHSNPVTLLFWIDFLDAQGELNKYSVEQIGSRTKVLNEKKVDAIYHTTAPEVLFFSSDAEPSSTTSAYVPIQINAAAEQMFTKAAQGISATDKMNEILNQHINNALSISLTTTPIFYLQPNTRIWVNGYGDYTIDKLSFQLGNNGSMSLSGTKITDQLY